MTGDFHHIRPPKKNKWAAYLLNMIFPGVGLLYWRRETGGLLWLISSLSISVSLICFWMLIPFLPQLLLYLLLLYWLFAQVTLTQKINTETPTEVIWSRNSNGLPSFFGLAILALSLVSLVIYIGMTRVYSFVYVRDMSMYPQILEGDILLVDRRVHEDRFFNVGEVVAYNSLTNGITISRVLASSQHTKKVEVLGAQIKLDEQELYLQPVEMDLPYLTLQQKEEYEYYQFYLEHGVTSVTEMNANHDSKQSPSNKNWLISEPLDPAVGRLTLTGRLGKNTLLVLPDVRRPNQGQLGHYGEIIDQSRVIGRPLMVIFSSYKNPHSSSRQGLKIH